MNPDPSLLPQAASLALPPVGWGLCPRSAAGIPPAWVFQRGAWGPGAGPLVCITTLQHMCSSGEKGSATALPLLPT